MDQRRGREEKRLRFLLYSHDTYGLGHIRRTLSIAWGLNAAFPRASILCVTGSSCAGSFPLPRRCDLLKLPTVTKDSAGRYVPREVAVPFRRIRAVRAAVIDAGIRSFQPHLILVDHSPLGMAGEVLPALRRARVEQPGVRIVLGLRDIYDDAALVRRDWRRRGVLAALEEVYDRILVYGQPEVFDVAREYGLSPAVARKVVYTGYVHRPDPAAAAQAHGQAPGSGGAPQVLLTVGGGGDGYRIVEQYLEGLAALGSGCPWRSLVVLGPLMSALQRRAARAGARALAGVSVIDFTPRLGEHLASADLVLTMGGYNTLLEALALGKRTVVVPRVRPRREQLVRALRFQARGLLRCIDPRRSTPAGLVEAVREAMAGPPPSVGGSLDLGGLERTVSTVAEVLGDGAAGAVRERRNGAGSVATAALRR